MRYACALVSISFLLSVGATPALAQKGRGAEPAHPTGKPAGVPEAPEQHTPGPKENGGGKAHTAPSTTTKTAASTTTSSTGTTTPVTTTTPTSTSVKNPKLEQRLKLLLPAGTNVADASKGFKNWGQFVAAVHVAHNLNVPFASLKAKMTGKTPLSLGQAIQALKTTGTTPTPVKPSTVQTEVRKAESEADDDLRVARK
jgi:hypothetical protein